MPLHRLSFDLWTVALFGADVPVEALHYVPRPACVRICVEPVSHDRVFIHTYKDHPPYAFRLSLEDILKTRGELLRLEVKHRH